MDAHHSYAIVTLLYDAWARGELMMFNEPSGITGIDLLDRTADTNHDAIWWNNLMPAHSLPPLISPMSLPELAPRIIENMDQLYNALNNRLGGIP